MRRPAIFHGSTENFCTISPTVSCDESASSAVVRRKMEMRLKEAVGEEVV
jgi:hypothetical protein